MIELLTAQRQIDTNAVDAGALAVALRQFYCRKYVIRSAGPGAALLEAETRDLIDTTARFVGRMDDGFRSNLESKIEESFRISADDRQRAMGLSYIAADLDTLIGIVADLARPTARPDRETDARVAASAGIEQLLCGTRIIRKVSDALGFEDPESVAAKVDTAALQRVIADILVAEVKRANAR